MLYKKENYIDSKDLLKLLIPAFEDPKKLINKGAVEPETKMLYRECITTLLSQIMLQNSQSNSAVSYEIWKYTSIKEGDGRLHQIEDMGKYMKIIKQPNNCEDIEIEQVYVPSEEEGLTTDLICERLKSKNREGDDRSGEVLCVFVGKDSVWQGGIDLEKVKTCLRTNNLIFEFYYVISLRASEGLKYYTYELVDLRLDQERHHRVCIRLEPLEQTFEIFGSEEEYLSKYKNW